MARRQQKIYRGLGRSGPAVSARGLMRRRGPIGGGTARKELPQLGQNSRPAFGPERCARNQCPRAEHSGLMHCTVHPGKYCIVLPPSGRGARTLLRRASEAVDTADCDAGSLWCQEQTTQHIGVGLPGCGFPVKSPTIIDEFSGPGVRCASPANIR